MVENVGIRLFTHQLDNLECGFANVKALEQKQVSDLNPFNVHFVNYIKIRPIILVWYFIPLFVLLSLKY